MWSVRYGLSVMSTAFPLPSVVQHYLLICLAYSTSYADLHLFCCYHLSGHVVSHPNQTILRAFGIHNVASSLHCHTLE